jgi:hypothetical protein
MGCRYISATIPLRALAVAWSETDPQAALAVVDMMDREADKAEAASNQAYDVALGTRYK